MKVSQEYCSGCPIFEDGHKDNMIKYDVCHRRDMTGCYKENKK